MKTLNKVKALLGRGKTFKPSRYGVTPNGSMAYVLDREAARAKAKRVAKTLGNKK